MRSVLAAAATMSFCAAASASVTLNFFRVEPHNSAVNPADQFSCVVSDFAPGVVSFRFTNNVGIASSISEVYYDDGPMLGIASLVQQGCSFTGGAANPGDLPGGQNLTPPFHATQEFSADAQGSPSLGIDTSDDFLEMRFNLINNKTFADIVSALNTGELRVGMHVRAIGEGASSDSFVNTPLVIAPLPSAAWLGVGGLGIAGILRVSRRRSC
jgi:hypothetical protein